MRAWFFSIFLFRFLDFASAAGEETKYDLKLPWGTYRGVINETVDEEASKVSSYAQFCQ
jgi:hypothetical protein